MGRTQHFELECLNLILVNELAKHRFSSLDAIITNIVPNFLGVENIKPISIMLLCLSLGFREALIGLHYCCRLFNIKLVRLIRISWWSIARPELILRICLISIIWILVCSPCRILLRLEHLLHFLSHWLGKLSVCIEWSIVTCVNFRILVFNVHTASTWEISVANDHALISLIFQK